MLRFFGFHGASAACLVIISLAASPTSAQPASETYYSGGREIDLSLSTDWILAQTAAEREEHVAARIVEQVSDITDFLVIPNPRSILLHCGAHLSEPAYLRALEATRTTPEVRLASACYLSEGHELFLTQEVLAQFAAGVGIRDVTALVRTLGMSVVREVRELPGWYLLRIDNATRIDAIAASVTLKRLPSVLAAHPNFLRFIDPCGGTDDTYYPNQWALNNTGSNSPGGGGRPDADIDAPEAWEIETGGSNVTIAVIDTGVQTQHPDLASKITDPYDATDGDDNQEPNSWDGHGTSCAGIAAAISGNSLGVAGVSQGAKIMPIRIFYSPAPGQDLVSTDYWCGLGIAMAALAGADVLSNSWSGSPSDFITFAIRYARLHGRQGRGCVIVFAAGNEDVRGISYPARLPEVVAVGATNEWDERKSRVSSDGENWWGSNFGPELDVVAPGVHIYTTDITGSGGFDPGDYFCCFNGTSAATPHVAGLAALLLSHNPAMNSDELQSLIESTADDGVGTGGEDTPGRDDYMGWGRINAYVAALGVSDIRVPQDFATIQEAIDAAANGGRIIVDRGIYVETVDCQNKGVYMQSKWGPQATIIDAGKAGRVVTMSHSTIDGFTITGGFVPSSSGGGVSGGYGSAILNCIVTDNWAGDSGGGIYLSSSVGWTTLVRDCIVSGNLATNGGGVAISAYYGWECTLINLTITGNTASVAGGGLYVNNGSVTIWNSVLWGDAPQEIAGLAQVWYSDVQGGYGGTGNIYENPLFVDQDGLDPHLTFPSPCRDAGSDIPPFEPTDVEGDPRDDSIDMGADEFYRHLYHTGEATPAGAVAIKLVGAPGLPATLLVGSWILDPPSWSPWGDWYLGPPLLGLFPLGTLPDTGWLSMPYVIPAEMPVPFDIPMQALVGDRFSNLDILMLR